MIKFWDFVHWLIHGLDGIKDAIMGSLIYSLYSHIHLKKTVWKNILSFFAGTVVSIYATPQILYFFPNLNTGFVGFICGVMGMKFLELAIEYDWESLMERVVAVWWGKKENKETKETKKEN